MIILSSVYYEFPAYKATCFLPFPVVSKSEEKICTFCQLYVLLFGATSLVSAAGYFYSHQISLLPIILQASVIWLHVPEISICSSWKIKVVEEEVGSFKPCLVFCCKETMRRFFLQKTYLFFSGGGCNLVKLACKYFSLTLIATLPIAFTKTQYIFVQENYRLI